MIEFGKLIKEHDPGNVGDRLIPIAENTNHAVELFVARNSTYFDSFYKDEDGTYKWGATHEDTLEGLKLFKEAYVFAFLARTSIRSRTNSMEYYFLMTGFAGATFLSTQPRRCKITTIRFKRTSVVSYEHIHMATVLGEDGYYHQRDLINYWGMIIFNPDISDEKFERYMDILEYNATREGYLTTVLGLKGHRLGLRRKRKHYFPVRPRSRRLAAGRSGWKISFHGLPPGQRHPV